HGNHRRRHPVLPPDGNSVNCLVSCITAGPGFRPGRLFSVAESGPDPFWSSPDWNVARECCMVIAFIMATVRPFRALRPKPELASRICELPYDVMSSEEAREIAKDNPLSFLHVSKPEIDLPPGTDPYAPEVY